MRGLNTHSSKTVRTVAIIGCLGLASLTALPAHAIQVKGQPLQVTTSMPDIHNEADRIKAIENFRRIAKKACDNSGSRGLAPRLESRACTADLVEAFTQKIDAAYTKSKNSMAHKETETCYTKA